MRITRELSGGAQRSPLQPGSVLSQLGNDSRLLRFSSDFYNRSVSPAGRRRSRDAPSSPLQRDFLGHHEDTVGQVEKLLLVGPDHLQVARLGEGASHVIRDIWNP